MLDGRIRRIPIRSSRRLHSNYALAYQQFPRKAHSLTCARLDQGVACLYLEPNAGSPVSYQPITPVFPHRHSHSHQIGGDYPRAAITDTIDSAHIVTHISIVE